MSTPISPHTRPKNHFFDGVVHAELAWFKKFKAGRFVYIDMNAYEGRGSDEQGEIEGSPIRFLREAESMGVQTNSILFEIKKSRYDALCRNMGELWTQDHWVAPFLVDNKDLVAAAMRYTQGTCGLGYIDPCGTGIPFLELARIATDNVNLLINTDGRSFSRREGAGDASFAKQFAALRKLKKHWFIAPPDPQPQQRWGILYGANEPRYLTFHELKVLGFEELESAAGRQYFDEVFTSTSKAGPKPVRAARNVPKAAKAAKPVKSGKRDALTEALLCVRNLPAALLKNIREKLAKGWPQARIEKKYSLSKWPIRCIQLVARAGVAGTVRGAAPVAASAVPASVRPSSVARVARSIARRATARRMFTEDNKSRAQIVKELGVNYHTVGLYLAGLIPTAGAQRHEETKKRCARAREMFLQEGKSKAQIEKELGIASSTLRAYLRGLKQPVAKRAPHR